MEDPLTRKATLRMHKVILNEIWTAPARCCVVHNTGQGCSSLLHLLLTPENILF